MRAPAAWKTASSFRRTCKKLQLRRSRRGGLQTTRAEGRRRSSRPREFTIIGQSQKRKDTPAKVDGSCIYGIDVKLPDMLYAALAQPPALGGSVKTFNDEKARAMPGVKAVVLTSSGVAVVADSWWQARKARDQLAIQWEAGPNGALNDAKICADPAQGRGGRRARRAQ